MVKRLTWPFADPCWGIAFAHIVPYDSPASPDWHIVHEYFGDAYFWMLFPWNAGFYPDDAWEAAHNRLPGASAREAALDLAAHCQVVTDLCPYTHGSYWQGLFCPAVPRWNIYRGQRGEPLIPCFYWDFFAVDPPPGYHWYTP